METEEVESTVMEAGRRWRLVESPSAPLRGRLVGRTRYWKRARQNTVATKTIVVGVVTVEATLAEVTVVEAVEAVREFCLLLHRPRCAVQARPNVWRAHHPSTSQQKRGSRPLLLLFTTPLFRLVCCNHHRHLSCRPT